MNRRWRTTKEALQIGFSRIVIVSFTLIEPGPCFPFSSGIGAAAPESLGSPTIEALAGARAVQRGRSGSSPPKPETETETAMVTIHEQYLADEVGNH